MTEQYEFFVVMLLGIVLAHGGKIWVESQGHDETNCPGSCFYVRSPLLAQPGCE